MKRYWLFCFSNSYPLGGFFDFYGHFDSIQECHDFRDNNYEGLIQDKEHFHIFDSKSQKVVETDNSDFPDNVELRGFYKHLKPVFSHD